MKYKIPTYDEAVEICRNNVSFYESKMIVDGFNISIFNYRLAQNDDFKSPIKGSNLTGYELRGLTFVFNLDGTLYNRYLMLNKFFNLNQTEDTLYDIVSKYTIKYINNKEDGSLASFIMLPNGDIIGRSKMGFDNSQSYGINRVYKSNKYIQEFVNKTLNNNIIPIFEYVAPDNRIVLRYEREDLILLKLRDNTTGSYIDVNKYLDENFKDIKANIKVANYETYDNIDALLDDVRLSEDKEGSIVHCLDNDGYDFLYKVKTPWYCERHGLLTNDLYRENILIGYILDDKIDDIIAQIPSDEVEAIDRISMISNIVKEHIINEELNIEKAYNEFLESGLSVKEYALKNRIGNKYFSNVMSCVKYDRLKSMTNIDDILMVYDTIEHYNKSLESCTIFNQAINSLRKITNSLQNAREWLMTKNDKFDFYITNI